MCYDVFLGKKPTMEWLDFEGHLEIVLRSVSGKETHNEVARGAPSPVLKRFISGLTGADHARRAFPRLKRWLLAGMTSFALRLIVSIAPVSRSYCFLVSVSEFSVAVMSRSFGGKHHRVCLGQIFVFTSW